MNECIKCGKETEDGLKLSNGSVIPACAGCTDPHIEQYRKMQADATKMKEDGVHPDMVNRIMCVRVDNDYYTEKKND